MWIIIIAVHFFNIGAAVVQKPFAVIGMGDAGVEIGLDLGCVGDIADQFNRLGADGPQLLGHVAAKHLFQLDLVQPLALTHLTAIAPRCAKA